MHCASAADGGGGRWATLKFLVHLQEGVPEERELSRIPLDLLIFRDEQVVERSENVRDLRVDAGARC